MSATIPHPVYETPVTVRALARGGKFLGDDIGGALVAIHHAQTGALLADGRIAGGSGDLWNVMEAPINRTQSIPTAGASAFIVKLRLTSPDPVPLQISVTGPGAGLQSATTVTVTQWVTPGLLDGNGQPFMNQCQVELPGLLLQVLEPASHTNLASLPQSIPLRANVAMMCGCPIDNNTVTDGTHSFPNPWPVSDFNVWVRMVAGGVPVDTVALVYDVSNTPGLFTGTYQMTKPGFYEAQFTALQLSTGNVGTGTVSFFNIPPAG
jgi:hypothetical protein